MTDRGVARVRKATDDDVLALAGALARAFFDDPVLEWMVPDARRRERTGPLGFETWLRKMYLPKGEVYTDERRAAGALWAPPGAWKLPPAQQLRLLPRMVRIFGARRLPMIMSGLTAIEKQHPDDRPHWYLAVLGTDPEHQGRGIGSAVMQPVLERCDADGVPAYLESSKERNVPYYRRHGFEVTAEFELPEGPPLWGMWREPRQV